MACSLAYFIQLRTIKVLEYDRICKGYFVGSQFLEGFI